MELALVVVLVVALYLWSRAKERRDAERRALRWFTHYEEIADHLQDKWEADLVEMTMRYERIDYEGPSDEPVQSHSLRRKDGGRWQIRLTSEAQSQRLDWLEKQLSRKMYLPSLEERYRAELEILASGKVRWSALPAYVASPLEPQYQRFLLHWREG